MGLMNLKALLVMIGALNFGLDMFNEMTKLLKFGSYGLGVMNWNTLLLMYGALDLGLNNFDDKTKLLKFGI